MLGTNGKMATWLFHIQAELTSSKIPNGQQAGMVDTNVRDVHEPVLNGVDQVDQGVSVVDQEWKWL